VHHSAALRAANAVAVQLAPMILMLYALSITASSVSARRILSGRGRLTHAHVEARSHGRDIEHVIRGRRTQPGNSLSSTLKYLDRCMAPQK
jgi:hypothetical protein